MSPVSKDDNTGRMDGWLMWGNHVLEELRRLNDGYENMNDHITQIKVEIGMLKVKSGVWGLMGGLVPVIIGLAYVFLER